MAALTPYSACRTALVLAAALLALPAGGWAKDIPGRSGQTENVPPQNPPPEAQPKAPAPSAVKTGVIRPPDVSARSRPA